MKITASILVVDDDPDIGSVLKMMLDFKGYEVTLLNHANAVEQSLEQQPFDLIILDMLISGVNGTDVCTAIRQNRKFSQVPILMISALPDAMKTCLAAGASDFISKPFEMKEILSKISNLLRSQQSVS